MKRVLTSVCLMFSFALLVNNSFAQGSGNHMTMSLQNCSQPSANTIQFDLYVVSDGSPASDLRANSFQCGINFNKGFLQSGATIKASYIKGSTDFSELNEFNFPVSSSSDHIRIVQSVYTKGNTGKTMVVGRPYRVGTFLLTSSANFVVGKNPELSLQSKTVAGKTLCAAVGWVGAAGTTNGITIPGSGTAAMERVGQNGNSPIALSVTIGCRLGESPVSGDNSLNVYPNPANGMVTVSFSSNSSEDYLLTVIDAANREVMKKDVKGVKGSNSLELDLSNLAKGAYMINLKSGNINNSVKTVLQ